MKNEFLIAAFALKKQQLKSRDILKNATK